METLSALLDIYKGNHRSPVDSPHKGPVRVIFDVSFVVSLNKLLKKKLPLIWDAMIVMWRHDFYETLF